MMNMTTQRPLDHRQLGTWQRALDILLELHSINDRLAPRDFEQIGKTMWHQALLMLSEIALLAQTRRPEERATHLLRSQQALCRLHARYDIARQLRLLDPDPEFTRQLDRQRLELEQMSHAIHHGT